MKRYIHLLPIVFFALLLASCKSSKNIIKTDGLSPYLSSKVELTVPHGETTLTVNGTMKMKEGELVQMSLLMPLFRTEVARIEATPTYLLIVDRMNRRFVKATPRELRDYLPADSYKRLEKMIKDAAKPGGKATLTGQELGIKQLAKAKIELYDFSDEEISIEPTELSSRYRMVTMEEILQLLMSL
ncbi:MAG: DUF4292 domain-containing protein [Bacteroidaceae bacterium]|jgi:hypothetical protein|nr:DUF4292 domain-containing protein [Bacteroidaceae bacterium]